MATGRLGEQDGTLRATTLDASLDASGALVSGRATGAVRFESPEGFASADRAEWSGSAGGEVRWIASGDAKARLAQADRRIAAESIRLRPGSSWMLAEGRAPDAKREQYIGTVARESVRLSGLLAKNETAKAKSEAVIAKLTSIQIPLGVGAVALGVASFLL